VLLKKGLQKVEQVLTSTTKLVTFVDISITTSKAQIMLYKTLTRILPNHYIQMNYRHPDLAFSKTKQPMEVDIYVPSLAFGIEYQGLQHFQRVPVFGSFTNQKDRDQEKRKTFQQNGITVVEIPYP
jgi:hypothetical protein